MNTFKVVLAVILTLAIIIGAMFGFGYLGVGYTKTVGKAQQDARREVFEATRSYNQGKVQELAKCLREYDAAEDKSAIRATIIHRFADYDESNLPAGMASKLSQIRGY